MLLEKRIYFLGKQLANGEYLTGDQNVYRRPSNISYQPGMTVTRRATIASDEEHPHVPQDGLGHANHGYDHVSASKDNLTYFN